MPSWSQLDDHVEPSPDTVNRQPVETIPTAERLSSWRFLEGWPGRKGLCQVCQSRMTEEPPICSRLDTRRTLMSVCEATRLARVLLIPLLA